MNNKTPLNDDLYLVAYLAGELAADEVTQFERAVEQDSLLAADLAAMRSVWDIPPRRRQWDTERLRKAFFQWRDEHVSAAEPPFTKTADLPAIPAHRINQEYLGLKLDAGPQTFRTARQKMGVFSGRTLRRGMWYAATGLILGVVLLLVSWHATNISFLGRPGRGPVSTYVTANGQRATVTLPDGNTAMLNVGSRLDVPVDYLAGNRTLRLAGEAMFTITHHEAIPVTVVAGMATTHVLGTVFLVRHYATDRVTTVAVRDGKVAVQSGNMPPVVLAAAQQLTVGHAVAGQMQGVNPTAFSFATGVLTIDGWSLQEAIPELDRWYDADIRLGDSRLATRNLRGGFTAGSLAELEEQLEWVFNLRVVRMGRTMTLYPR